MASSVLLTNTPPAMNRFQRAITSMVPASVKGTVIRGKRQISAYAVAKLEPDFAMLSHAFRGTRTERDGDR
jgi:hypothetical protein